MRNGEEAALCVSVPPPFQGSINEGNRLNFEKHIQDLTACHCKRLLHINNRTPWVFEQIAPHVLAVQGKALDDIL